MEMQEIRTFGRRHGKKLSARQDWLIQNILPTIAPHSGDILEIGFGAGEHLRQLATRYPDKIIIGAEPFMNGVASLLSAMCDDDNTIRPEYKNIRILADDVRILLKNPNLKFEQIWILHPDPWPKARHEKRRLLSTEFLNILSQHITPDGQIIIGTDHHEYFDWICTNAAHTSMHAQIPNIATIKTRYQTKNMAGTDAPKYIILSH